ncbi:hypothetical protein BDV25DRAFT_52700 [Aspergillus avenaceus]|uniref:Nuclear pore assembly and biogenesis-domain-containing protein n=1 Tax=Aspergillus avenaceus TaxID=36643 RepID=A0A5N6U2G8_ASPAV|nr:hypothetical protein BDV25DRAFT_52700 [Aspergillus avenaceus]
MEFLPESLVTLIQENPTIQQLASTSVVLQLNDARATYLDPYVAQVKATYLDPYLIQPLATMLASSMPSLLSVFILALVFIVSLKILDYGRRLVMFWISLALRLVWWAFVLGAIWYVYTSGLEKTGRDLGWVYGVARGFAENFHDGAEGGRSSATGGFGYYTARDFQVR